MAAAGECECGVTPMMAGFMALGALTMFAVPEWLGSWRGGSDGGRDEPGCDDPPDEMPCGTESAGQLIELGAQPGVSIVPDFRPGEDRLTLRLPEAADDFVLHDADEDVPARLTWMVGADPMEVQFDGLGTVPLEDIDLRLLSPFGPSTELALVDALEPMGDEGDPPVDPGAVLQPLGPDGERPEGPLADLVGRYGGAVDGLPNVEPPITSGTDGPDELTGGDRMAERPVLREGTPDLGDVPVLDGGGGDDTILGTGSVYGFGGVGDDVLQAGTGSSALYGGAGADVVAVVYEAGEAPQFLHGGSGDDVVQGGAGADRLGGGEHDTAPGGSGDDTLAGQDGDDTLRGGWGADLLTGGAGDDLLDHRGTDAELRIAEHHEHAWHVDGEADTLSGGRGDDTVRIDLADTASGGAGADVFWVHQGGGDAAVIQDFEPGADILRISLDPHGAETPEDVALSRSEDGADTLVTLRGETLVVLRGCADAGPADLYVEKRADVFP